MSTDIVTRADNWARGVEEMEAAALWRWWPLLALEALVVYGLVAL